MRMGKVKVSIIIVRYREKEELFRCLETIKGSKPKTSCEVIVVDNNIKKRIGFKLKKKFAWVKYVKSPGNIGYGAGNNLGAKFSKGEYLFILNPDTEVLPGAIDSLVHFLEKNKKAAIVAPNLVDEKGKIFSQLGSRTLTPLRGIIALSFLNKLFPNNPISRKYWLKDVSMDKKREVDAVPGSAFLTRKKVFEEVGSFDKNFFLYFEESDLGKRVREASWKIFIIPEAQIVHFWKETSPSKKFKQAFIRSRFYYFKKHYGLVSAALVEFFASFSKWHACLILVTLIGAFLRFYRIDENLVFHGELGHNYLAIKNFIIEHRLPLLGPPTSHPWLSFGPLYYWIFAPILVLGGYNPIAGAYFFALVGVLVIVLNYFVISKIFNDKLAVISSFLIAISPSFIQLTRGSRFFSLVILFFYLFFFFLIKAFKENSKHIFWAGFFLGVMLNFHLTPIVLIPTIFTTLFIYREKVKSSDIIKGIGGFLLPNIPFLLYNALNNFVMLFKFTLWIPYRISGFVGLYPKNTVSLSILKSNLVSLYKFITFSFVQNYSIVGFFLFAAVLLFIFFKVKKILFGKENIAWVSTFLIFIWGYLGIFVHGTPPSHYYLPLYSLPILFLSEILTKLDDKKNGRIVVVAIIFLISLINLRFFFSNQYFNANQDRVSEGKPVPYHMQQEVAENVVEDARDRPFTLSRVGPYDYFEGDYAQNYQYLMWFYGNEPVRETSLKYTIYEDVKRLPDVIDGKLFTVNNIVVLRKKL